MKCCQRWNPSSLCYKNKIPEKLHKSHNYLFSFLQHDFIRSAKPNSILRALITDAMEVKLKRQEEAEQRRLREAQDDDDDEDDNSVC